MTSKKRRVLTIALVASVVAAVVLMMGALLVLLLQNSLILSSMTSTMKRAARNDPHITCVETQHVYGKLNGNGNGIDFFGAMLVTADSEADVAAFAASLKNEYELVSYHRQVGNDVDGGELLEHRHLSYNTEIPNDDSTVYYTVYYYDHSEFANLLDIAGN